MFLCIDEDLTSISNRNLRKDTDNSVQQKFCLDIQLCNFQILSTFQSILLCFSGVIAIVHCSHLKRLLSPVYAIKLFRMVNPCPLYYFHMICEFISLNKLFHFHMPLISDLTITSALMFYSAVKSFEAHSHV